VDVAQVPTWNVPYQRNPLFKGREDVLKRLSEALRAGKTAALAQPQAISGLGGIGKTQTAVEYAYRYRDDYRVVLWVKAETQGSINSDFVTIAHLLNLAEKQEQDQHKIVEAVKRRFQGHTDWLLILDNADDLAMVQGFLPLGSRGHILLTTRAHATGRIVKRIEVEKMDPDEGALFLLRRSTLLDSNALLEAARVSDRNTAREIVKAMGGLPLALEQAGAYMEETACGLQGYVRLYRAKGVQLLKEHSEFDPDHPEPVATTWSLSFEKVGHANAAAAELLRFCAFLAPDAIPEELFAESAAELGPILEPVASDPSRLNAAIRELLKYSLVQRDPETQTLSIHRLVQEVLKDL
jgi:NB-ARC domain